MTIKTKGASSSEQDFYEKLSNHLGKKPENEPEKECEESNEESTSSSVSWPKSLLDQRQPNPPCPFCGYLATVKKGLTRSGDQRYYCRSCRRSFQNNIYYRSDVDRAMHIYNAYYYLWYNKYFLAELYQYSLPLVNKLISDHRNELKKKNMPYFNNQCQLIDQYWEVISWPFVGWFKTKVKTLPHKDPDSGFVDQRPVYISASQKPWPQMEARPLYEPTSREDAFKNLNLPIPGVDPRLREHDSMKVKLWEIQVDQIESGEGEFKLKFNPDPNDPSNRDEPTWRQRVRRTNKKSMTINDIDNFLKEKRSDNQDTDNRDTDN